MNEKLEGLFQAITQDEYGIVARSALGSETAKLNGPPQLTEITNPHYDPRTIGIVRVAGMATDGEAEAEWSAVVKVIDTSVGGNSDTTWVNPEIEQSVYELGLFSDMGLPFRPARCYRVSLPKNHLKLFWLEDLTDAEKSPFNVEQLGLLANGLGQFNGYCTRHEPEVPFELATNHFAIRWKGANFKRRADELDEILKHDAVQRSFHNTRPDIVRELHEPMSRLVETVATFPGAVTFGDSAAGNVFLSGTDTVAIDWANVGIQPVGVDCGVLAGSSITWGRDIVAVASREREVFDSYLEGLTAQGWSGNPHDVRRGYMCQFGMYLLYVAYMPLSLVEDGKYFSQDFLASRFETPIEELPEAFSGIIDLVPGFTAKVNELVN